MMLQLPLPLSLSSLDQHMVPIQGGSFRLRDKLRVQLTDYQLCRFPVTQRLWREVMEADPERLAFSGLERPVERVSWYDAVDFCNRLSERLELEPCYQIDQTQPDPHNQNEFDDLKWTVRPQAGATGYRLPTEAEWEYAAREGAYPRGYTFSGSEDLAEVGWYEENSFGETQVVGLRRPNALGLYGLSGNVWEWCWDWYGKYPAQVSTSYTGPTSGVGRVSRGGSWSSPAASARVARRYGWHPGDRHHNLGFRLARSH